MFVVLIAVADSDVGVAAVAAVDVVASYTNVVAGQLAAAYKVGAAVVDDAGKDSWVAQS